MIRPCWVRAARQDPLDFMTISRISFHISPGYLGSGISIAPSHGTQIRHRTGIRELGHDRITRHTNDDGPLARDRILLDGGAAVVTGTVAAELDPTRDSRLDPLRGGGFQPTVVDMGHDRDGNQVSMAREATGSGPGVAGNRAVSILLTYRV